jgi:mRNA interferase RelE/StbE
VTPYSVCFKASVEKDLRRIPATARDRCLERIDLLRGDPRPRGVTRLTGSDRTYRLRVGAYRVVYQIDDDERVLVVEYVRHRKDAYR